jgi:hypothetical protein
MREIQGTYENCKNSLIWRQGKARQKGYNGRTHGEHIKSKARQKGYNGRTHGEHIKNKLGTYGEVCVSERWKETGGERQRETLE